MIKTRVKIEDAILPFLLVLYGTIFIARSFFGLFETALTGTLICLGVDLDLNQGQLANGPPNLHKSLDKIFDVDKQVVVVQAPQVGEY